MSRRAALLACLLAAAFAGCSRTGSPGERGAENVIGVYVDEDPKDPNNLKKFRIGAITLGPGGRLALSIEKEVPAATETLRRAVAQIQSRKSLQLAGETPKQVDGKTIMVTTELEVSPGDPRYIHAVASALQTEFGLDAR